MKMRLVFLFYKEEKNLKIAVMAGTPIDTEMGEDMLKENGFLDLISFPISENPIEQTIFQTSTNDFKEKVINEKIDFMKKNDSDILFVYCNSLSGAVDFEKISRERGVKIITPLQIYFELAKEYRKIAVISANAQGLSGIENVFFKSNPEINVVGLTFLEVVKEIEKGILPEKISQKFNFDGLVKYLETLNVEAIVLGCTHFPYIIDEIRKRTNIKIINPADKMVSKILEK